MDTGNKKIITFSFLAAGALVALATGLMIDAFAGTWGVVARAASNDLFRHGLPVVLGLLTFGILQFNKKVSGYSEEIVAEVKKVVWPSQKDTIAMTVVVCVMLIISGFILGVFDFVSGYVINAIVK